MLVHADDKAMLDVTLGQQKILLHALALLNSTVKDGKSEKNILSETATVTTN